MTLAIWCSQDFSIAFPEYKSINSFQSYKNVLHLWSVNLSRQSYTPCNSSSGQSGLKEVAAKGSSSKEEASIYTSFSIIISKSNLGAAVKGWGRYSGNVSCRNDLLESK